MPKLSEVVINKFPFSPTKGQKKLLGELDGFVFDKKTARASFVINGYAGTGKTLLLSCLVKALPLFNIKFVLLAPTGRAAKVMSNYSKKVAFTIHKKIYKQKQDPDTGLLKFVRQKNYHSNTLFIIDEVSMIDEKASFATRGVLNDLIDFVFENTDNQLILIGDSAQLPPVGQSESLALNTEYLRSRYDLNIKSFELTEVTRQDLNSGILHNATYLRKILGTSNRHLQLTVKGLRDVYRMGGEKMEEGIRYAYDKFGISNTVVICRSNRACLSYNNLIRRNLLFRDEMLEAGDIIMVAKNNYFYRESPAGFLANGDFLEIIKVVNYEEEYGISFGRLLMRLIDYPDTEPFEALIIMDSLYSGTAELPGKITSQLAKIIRVEYQNAASEIKNDPYLNALQVKFAYAFTCHKSQGGQWDAVFVDQGYITEEKINDDYIRWLYTAITRSSKELYLVNFHGDLFSNNSFRISAG